MFSKCRPSVHAPDRGEEEIVPLEQAGSNYTGEVIMVGVACLMPCSRCPFLSLSFIFSPPSQKPLPEPK